MCTEKIKVLDFVQQLMKLDAIKNLQKATDWTAKRRIEICSGIKHSVLTWANSALDYTWRRGKGDGDAVLSGHEDCDVVRIQLVERSVTKRNCITFSSFLAKKTRSQRCMMVIVNAFRGGITERQAKIFRDSQVRAIKLWANQNRKYIMINERMRRRIDDTEDIVRKDASAGYVSNADFWRRRKKSEWAVTRTTEYGARNATHQGSGQQIITKFWVQTPEDALAAHANV